MARQQARRHQRERVGGAVLAALGVLVLFVAILALRDPRSTGSSAPTTTRTITRTHTAPATPSSSASSPSSSSSGNSAPPINLGSPSSKTSPAAALGSAAAHAIPLLVLNNTTVQGLAASAAQRFEAGGWTVTGEGNLTNSIISTCAYYDPGVTDAKAAAAALQAQYPTIKRVRPRFGGLPSGPIVVVLTPGYSSN